jgi:hypothetical protein
MDSQSRGRSDAAKGAVTKGAATTRKRKGSSAGPRGTAKRRARSGKSPVPAEQGPSRSDEDPVEQISDGEMVQVCRRSLN